MSNSFVFIGDPGPDTPGMLQLLTSKGISPKRFGEGDINLEVLEKASPLAIILAEDLNDRAGLIAALRERGSLSGLPVLVRFATMEPSTIASAFKDGADDFIIDGRFDQFSAIIANLTRTDSWNDVRAPVGMALLAHQNRLERVRFGRVLRKSGLDPYFVADSEVLKAALEQREARLVIAQSSIARGLSSDTLKHGRRESGPPAWIVVADENISFGTEDFIEAKVKLKVIGSEEDAEIATFLINELLSPTPPEGRRTPRILYGTPVSFKSEKSVTKPFWGFSYNINSGGLFVRTLAPFPLQSRIDISFCPPFGRGTVVMTAQVVWRKTAGTNIGPNSPPGMGIQVIDAARADKAGFQAGYEALLEDSSDKNPSYVSPPPI